MTNKSNKTAATGSSTTTPRTAPRPIPTREEFHRSYAGEIFADDFSTSGEYSCRNIGSRIRTAKSIDNQCKSNFIARKRRSTYGKEL